MTEARKRAKKAANAKTNMIRGIKGDISAEKHNRSHGNGSGGGGRLPSVEYVGSASEVKRRDGSGRTAFSAEGAERYDDRGPAPTANVASRYRAPSLTVVKAPVRPEVTPDYGKCGKGAPAVKAPEARIDSEIARKNLYARKGDYSGEGPALLPLPKIEVIQPYPRPEVSRAAYLKGPGLSVVELETPTDGAPVFKAGPLKGRPLVEPRVFKIDRLKGRRYARVRIPAKHGFPVLTQNTWVPFIHRKRQYHPGYDTSAWTRVRAPEELIYRALVML